MSSLRRAQHVLIAEPRASDLESILASLGEQEHFLVSRARTGDAVIEVLKSSGRNGQWTMPSVVLLDLGLQDPGALELIRWLRDCPRTNCIPIVVMDDGASGGSLARAYEAGANSCLSKPSSHEELEGVVRRITRYWLSLNQLPHDVGAAGNRV